MLHSANTVKENPLRFLRRLFKLLLFLVVVLIIGRIFLFEVAVTRSYDMVPNLIAGDVFLVSKHSPLGQGDIAVCRHPDNPKTNVVLRILGVPNSTIAIRNDHVFFNDVMVDRTFEGTLLYENRTAAETVEYFVDIARSRAGGHTYSLAFMDRAGNKNYAKHSVENGFLLLGDNRNTARDSRHFGEVDAELCIGKAVLLIWPADDNGDLKRDDRLFTLL